MSWDSNGTRPCKGLGHEARTIRGAHATDNTNAAYLGPSAPEWGLPGARTRLQRLSSGYRPRRVLTDLVSAAVACRATATIRRLAGRARPRDPARISGASAATAAGQTRSGGPRSQLCGCSFARRSSAGSQSHVLVGPGRRPRGSTRSSIALGRTSDTTENSLRTCRKITYSNRSDSPGSCPTGNHRWSATQARPLTLHRAKQLDIEPLPPEAPISAPRVDGPAVDRPQDPASPESQRLPQSGRVAVRDIGNNSDFFEAQVFREASTVLLEDAGQKRGDEET